MKLLTKYGILLIFSFLLFSMLTGCDNADDLTPKQIADSVLEEIDFPPMIELDKHSMSAAALNIESKYIEEAAIHLSQSEEKADEILVLKLVNPDDFDTVFTAISTQLSSKAENFLKKSSAESEKIQHAVIRRTEHLAIVVVCRQHEQAANLLNDLGTQPVK